MREVLELLGAGECYQVNLTRGSRATTRCDPVALSARSSTRHPAPHAALARGSRSPASTLAVVSASPERFLRVDGPRVETRPIKGTRARRGAALRASAKDRAENVMIVDLARNDLGRVCEPGTIPCRRCARSRPTRACITS